ncbi:quinone-dependent dihydroorotate dehydrogenase [Rhodobacter sp. Har01]|uniref:quinone-dependent dihydroorotate dehydrogenase n=1 Tax=Rhodobacter sp. Har01 TaxID=2883999 RepID=UPI001D0834DF|nr:quinone-dependent dihydroorotate dehydrogenase [Rhodobacter sp. Har01]MCB6178494.1 quinone-dependent dihydroorotate dehydrogenase [Rhodobacter sp. Har01]
MRLAERVGLAWFSRMEPERAHRMGLLAVQIGFAPQPGPVASGRLACDLAGMPLLNPVGLAAGFDKNATAVDALSKSGFGFLEVGAATPLPQPGNPAPRLFRLAEDRAVINRFGFNNEGAEVVAGRLARRKESRVPVGLNLGANKDSADRAGDFARVLATCGPHCDFATVNVSSPNTERLRELQGVAALTALLERVMEARAGLPKAIPVFLKVAPDLNDDELSGIAEVALASGLAGIIATNTTLSREGLKSASQAEAGGLSGAPLFEKSTRVLARLSQLTEGRLQLVGVGGISSPQDAYAKIKAGASAVQLYTALVYQGISLAPRIAWGLEALLRRDKHANVASAIGTDRTRWL